MIIICFILRIRNYESGVLGSLSGSAFTIYSFLTRAVGVLTYCLYFYFFRAFTLVSLYVSLEKRIFLIEKNLETHSLFSAFILIVITFILLAVAYSSMCVIGYCIFYCEQDIVSYNRFLVFLKLLVYVIFFLLFYYCLFVNL